MHCVVFNCILGRVFWIFRAELVERGDFALRQKYDLEVGGESRAGPRYASASVPICLRMQSGNKNSFSAYFIKSIMYLIYIAA